MEKIIRLLLENFTLSFLILGFIVAGLEIVLKKEQRSASFVVEHIFSNFLLFSIGFNFFLNFIFHVFFSQQIASFIGWEDSPFQIEVGMASLGFALVGFLAYKGRSGLRLAAITGPAVFLLGAAAKHIYDVISAQNLSPGNSGTVLYTDILIPLIGFILLYIKYRLKKKGVS
ncbi:MAG: hypothetical protein K9N05_06935 [Candidatus Marinimicrobia bacterium]|nr:hypothetical protein [Candidatus Neomarinimicrobiota bacterium]